MQTINNSLTKETINFIERSKIIHNGKYDYSQVQYKNNCTKVIIVCKDHGLFDQAPKKHIIGQGCKECGLIKIGNDKRKSNDQFIRDANKIHGNKYDYSLVKYVNSNTKVNIICSNHGTYYQCPVTHLNGSGCPKCGRKIANNKMILSNTIFIEKAHKIHGDKYDYSKVKYIKTDIKIIIICKEHGEFIQSPHSHLAGMECPICIKKILSINSSKTISKFIEQSHEIHRGKYDYSKVNYINNRMKIIIICKDHGEFEQTPHDHLGGSGCSKCSKNNLRVKLSRTNDEFIIKAKEIHSDKYDYSKVKYVNSKSHVTIICKEHGEFEQKPIIHTFNKAGCPTCSGNHQHTTDEWIKKAIEIHGDKYDYSKVNYKKNKEKIIIICKEHGDFLQTPSDHIFSKAGCPKCSGNHQYTNEEWIKKAIEIHGDRYDYSKVNYKKMKDKIIIICKIHGEFRQNPACHIRPRNCPKCGSESVGIKLRLTTDKFIKDAYNIHGDKYDYTKVNCNGHKDKVIIICKIHGNFTQTHNDHIFSKAGCPSCGSESTTKKQTKTHEQFMKEIKNIYGNKYDYSNTKYTKAHNEIVVVCTKHGVFNIKAYRHLQGQECKKCQMCPSCLLWRTQGVLCEYCKPSNKNKLYFKTKEMDVVKYLIEKLPDDDFIHNKSVGTECTGGHYFPDIRFDCIWFQLIVEVDEHKHRGSSYPCDEKRMYDITGKLGQPCIFIRYNPDSKNSKKETLLRYVKHYLNFQEKYNDSDDINVYDKLKIDDLLGFRTKYLFY
jgi:hypothetical protein